MRTLRTCELQCVIANHNATLKFDVINKKRALLDYPTHQDYRCFIFIRGVHIKKETPSRIPSDILDKYRRILMHTRSSNFKVSLDWKNRK